MDNVDKLAHIVWDYHHMNHELRKADCIFVLGSHDTRVAEQGARLFLEGWAPIVLFSGGIAHENDLLATNWKKPEAEVFADIVMKMGVPQERILIENKAKNVGENVAFTKKLLEERYINIKSIIAVQKPYMERRTYATIKEIWPEMDCIVTSPQISFAEYPTETISKNDVINIMVGDLQRIRLYPAKGFQIYQEIPDEVWNAYEQLCKLGFTKHLIL
ncbi:MAG: YdcF family protein [Patescibacteria group bacterium]|jgi:uncharacterized SAM-binding protein YcdF (DUF218 family)